MTLNTVLRRPLQSIRRSTRPWRRSSKRSHPFARIVDAIERVAPPPDPEWVRVREWMIPSSNVASTPARTVGMGVATAVALLAYHQLARPWHRTWGASEDEVKASLPGDELVAHPTYTATRAITVYAAPENIWPVLLALGHSRGHLYADDELEAAFGREADGTDGEGLSRRRLPRIDAVRTGPPTWIGRWHRMRVVEMIPRRALVFGSMDETMASHDDTDAQVGTWAFVLRPVRGSATRLLIRTRSRPSWARRPLVEAYDPISFLAERNLLMAIRRAAESAARTSRTRAPVHA